MEDYGISEQLPHVVRDVGAREHVKYPEVMGDLTEVAAMAYGSGFGEGIKGGKGHIGILNGKVIKFNTSAREYRHKTDLVYTQMMSSSNRLRRALLEMGTKVSGAGLYDRDVDVDRVGKKDWTSADVKAFLSRLREILGVETDESNREMACPREDDAGRIVLKKGEGLLTRQAAAKAVTLIRDYLRKHTETYSERDLGLVNRLRPGSVQNLDLTVWRKVRAMGDLSSHGAADGFARAQTAARTHRRIADAGADAASVLRAGNEASRMAACYPAISSDSVMSDVVNVRLGATVIQDLPREEAKNILYFQHARRLAESIHAMLGKVYEETRLPAPDVRRIWRSALAKVGVMPAEGEMDTVNARLSRAQFKAVLFEMRMALLPYALERRSVEDTEGRDWCRQTVRALIGKLDDESFKPPVFLPTGRCEYEGKDLFTEDVWANRNLARYSGDDYAVENDRAMRLKDVVVRADYRMEDLGAKNSAKYQVSLGGRGQALNRGTVFDKVQQGCQGQSACYAFAFVLNLFSEKSRALKFATAEEKQAYLELLAGLKTYLETMPNKKDTPSEFLYGALVGRIANGFHGERLGDAVRNELVDALSVVKMRYANGNAWRVLPNRPSFDLKMNVDYRPSDLGAKTSARYRLQVPANGVAFNAGALRQKILSDCAGMDFRQAYALALETFTEKSPGFMVATELQKAEYILLLKQMKAHLGEIRPDRQNVQDEFIALEALVRSSGVRIGGALAEELVTALREVVRCRVIMR